jgi:hypothetical protein
MINFSCYSIPAAISGFHAAIVRCPTVAAIDEISPPAGKQIPQK